jgi:hypothetical protein
MKIGAAFQIRMRDTCSQYQSLLNEFVRTSQIEADKRTRYWCEMQSFYDEKLSVLIQKKDEVMACFHMRLPRREELAILLQLEGVLRRQTMQMQGALREHDECQQMIVDRDKGVSPRFRHSINC